MRIWVALLCWLPSVGWAGGLQTAEGQFRKMEYARALKTAGRVLESPRSGPPEVVGAYRMQGLCLSGLGRSAEAAEAFARLLAIQPDFLLSSDISPKLAAPFYQAMALARDVKPLAMRHVAPEPTGPLPGVELVVELVANPYELVYAIRHVHQAASGKGWDEQVQPVGRAGSVRWTIPAGHRAPGWQYYFEATNKHGAVLARLGEQARPLTLQAARPVVAAPAATKAPEPVQAGPAVDPDARAVQAAAVVESSAQLDPVREAEGDTPAWYQTWWFWTALGAVVIAGAATGTALALGDSGPGAGDPVDYRVDYGVR